MPVAFVGEIRLTQIDLARRSHVLVEVARIAASCVICRDLHNLAEGDADLAKVSAGFIGLTVRADEIKVPSIKRLKCVLQNLTLKRGPGVSTGHRAGTRNDGPCIRRPDRNVAASGDSARGACEADRGIDIGLHHVACDQETGRRITSRFASEPCIHPGFVVCCDADIPCDIDRSINDGSLHFGGLCSSNVGPDQRIDGAKQNVLRLIAQRIESQRRSDRLAARSVARGGAVHRRFDAGSVLRVNRHVRAGGASCRSRSRHRTVGDCRDGGTQHCVRRDRGVDRKDSAFCEFTAARCCDRAADLCQDIRLFQGIDRHIAVSLNVGSEDVGRDAAANVIANNVNANGRRVRRRDVTERWYEICHDLIDSLPTRCCRVIFCPEIHAARRPDEAIDPSGNATGGMISRDSDLGCAAAQHLVPAGRVGIIFRRQVHVDC